MVAILTNARSRPDRLDPSRTAGLRRRWLADLRRRFAQLRKAVVDLVMREDAFGIRPPPHMVGNRRFAFQTTPSQVAEFERWLQGQMGSALTGHDADAAWQRYTEQGYQQGAGRAFDDLNKAARGQEQLDFYQGNKDQFLRSAFAQPVSVDKVKLLAGRTLDELKGVSHTMAVGMKRTLTDGLVQGKSPRDVARDMAKQVDIGLHRAERIARTETIRAHAEGQLYAMEKMGVEKVGVMVEWQITGDACELCAAMAGAVLTLKEASGMIPRHPS